MLTASDIVWGMVFPFLLAALIVIFTGRSRAGVALALAGAYVAGHASLLGFKWAEPQQVIVWIALIAGIEGILESSFITRRAHRWLARAIVSAALVYLTMRWRLTSTWGTPADWVLRGLLVVGVMWWWWVMDATAMRREGAVVPLVWAVAAGGVAAAGLFYGSQKLMQLGMVSTMALAGCALAAGVAHRRFSMGRGGTAVAVAVTAGLLLNELYVMELTWVIAIALGLVPLCAWVKALWGRRGWGWKGTATAAVIAMALVALVLLSPGLQFLKDMQGEF